MDWLYSWLEANVMEDDNRLKELLEQTEEWNTSSTADLNVDQNILIFLTEKLLMLLLTYIIKH